MDEIIVLLRKILVAPDAREDLILAFERTLDVLIEENSLDDAALDVLTDLRIDLSYYVADPVMRAEDPSYFGDERLFDEITGTLRKLGVQTNG